jgi:ribosomal protein L11 methyltransferase
MTTSQNGDGQPDWYIVSLQVEKERVDDLTAHVRESLGMEPVEIERPKTAVSWVEVYFDDETAAMLAAKALGGRPGVQGCRLRASHPRDWQQFWRHHFHRVEIGKRLLICPTWEADDLPENRHALILEPGLSFGTGDHFTTRFCLEVIDDLFFRSQPPAAMLDVGTGSGILAMAAARLGCRRVLGVEYDELSLVQAHENLERNGLSDRIELKQQDITEGWSGGQYDLVCANIFSRLLIACAADLVDAAGRWLVLTGILEREADGVAEVYIALGCREVMRDGDGEWCGILLEMPEDKDE